MLKKIHKLNTEEFKKLFDNGKKKHSDTFFIIYSNNPRTYKIGISTPKKKFKTAILRNSQKRKIYNFLQNQNIPNQNIIFVLKKPLTQNNN